MVPNVYYQVKVVVSLLELAPFLKLYDEDRAAYQYLIRNHLHPLNSDEVEVVLSRSLDGSPGFFTITAWVRDELCENYKPKGE